MYYLFIALLVSAGLWLVLQGANHHNRSRIIVGVGIVLATVAVYTLMSLCGDPLWYEALRLQQRLWVFLTAQVGTVIGGAAVAAATTMLIIWSLQSRPVRRLALTVAALGGAWWGTQSWPDLLIFFNSVAPGVDDPLFGKDTGLLRFALPFFDKFYDLLLYSVFVGIGASIVSLLLQEELSEFRIAEETADSRFKSVLVGSAVLVAVFAVGTVLEAYHLVFEQAGMGQPGSEGIDILPAYLGMGAILILFASVPLVPPLRLWLSERLTNTSSLRIPVLNALIALWLIIGAVWAVTLLILPSRM